MNLFTSSLDILRSMDERLVKEMHDRAVEKSGEFVDKYFIKHPRTHWIIIAHNPGNVIAAGPKEHEPFEDELELLAAQFNVPVFLYSRTDPFALTFADLKKMDEDEIDDVFRQGSAINREFADEYFKEHPQIGWIIIAHKPENIIAAGPLEHAPYSSDLDVLAEQLGVIVFAYSRPFHYDELTEEIIFS